MILTITLNPSVDISYTFEKLAIDTINRVEDPSKTAGGKGLNVARVLHQLNVEVGASGFLGGSLGHFIRAQVRSLGIQDLFVDIVGETRNCIGMIHEGKQTEILESGPTISEEEANLLLESFTKHLEQVDIITISGSLPKGLPNDYYAKLLKIAGHEDIPVLLDTSGSLIVSTLKNGPKPFFIKPNEEELAEIVGREMKEESDIKDALTLEIFEDIPWIVVTLGAKGAIIKHQETIYKANIPTIDAVNPVGSGDSVVAGFAAGFSKGLEDEALITYGLTMGILNALEEKTGFIQSENIDRVMSEIEVIQL